MTTIDKSLIAVRKLGATREVSNAVFQEGTEYACETAGIFLRLYLAKPSDFPSAPTCRAHVKSCTGRGVCVTIPTNLVDAIGWVPGEDYVTLRYGEENDILLSKSTQREILSYAAPAAKPAVKSGVVRRGRSLYLTNEQREFLDVPHNLEKRAREKNPFYLKLTIDFVGKTSIKIERMEDGDEGLPSLSELMKLVGGRSIFYQMPRTYRFHFTQSVILPNEFAKRCGFVKPEELVDVRTTDTAIIVSGRTPDCAFCGASPDSSVEATTPVYLCRGCADILPAANRLIKDSGSVSAAAKRVKKELRAALKAVDGTIKKGD